MTLQQTMYLYNLNTERQSWSWLGLNFQTPFFRGLYVCTLKHITLYKIYLQELARWYK